MLKRGIVLLFMVVSSCAAQEGSERLNQIIEPYVTSGRFMGTVLVARDGHVLLDKGYGYANLDWKIPNSPTTVFRLASLTKQFTAASILLLQQRGVLNISDPIGKYLPDAPKAWEKVTIYHLLTHTSGIPNYTTFPDQTTLEQFPITPMQLVARFWDKPLEFEPGEKYSYSNSGYAVLGYLIERLTGQSYGTFVEGNVFQPLGMKHSHFGSDTAVVPERASGYSPTPAGLVANRQSSYTMSYSAGGLCSTSEDLQLWEDALFSNQILSAASVKAMATPFKNGYALGLVTGTEGGLKLISHNGTAEGSARR